MIWNSIVIAVKQLARNKMRTALTSLGVLIGVAAVITMVNVGASATARINDDLAQLGEQVLFVRPGDPGRHGPPGGTRPMTMADARAIESVPGVAAVGPMASSGVVAVRGDLSWSTGVQGIGLTYLETQGLELQSGRPFTPGEDKAGAPVCILGPTVAEELFGSEDPLDQAVRVGQFTCTVIGVTEERGESTFGQDQDDFIQLPLSTFHRRLAGNYDVQMIMVRADEGTSTTELKPLVEDVMRDRRHVRPGMDDDFVVRDMKELEEMIGSITGVLTGLLTAIAAVSLLVGGIGIMNIMTVSVTERTREIGIRLAVGALARDVLLQFLVESVVLSVVGGVMGIGFGLLLSAAIARFLELPVVFDPATVALAFGVSGAIGVVFGYFPARKAARMKPIDALRHE